MTATDSGVDAAPRADGAQTIRISTRRGLEVDVLQWGTDLPDAPDLVWFHGIMGLLDDEPALAGLGRRFRVHAPVWPGFGPIENETAIADMLDFALFGWDVCDALGVRTPHLVGHSFGAMIAAEMACLAPHDLARLVLVCPYGLWNDAQPLPDPFAMLPFELADLLFADPAAHSAKLVSSGTDLESNEGLAEFMVRNSRRLGTAGKLMFPIPDRHVAKRLYRIIAPTRVVTGRDDRLVLDTYGQAWIDAIVGADLVELDGGHLLNVESPAALGATVEEFLSASTTA